MDLRIYLSVKCFSNNISSVSTLCPNAIWLERELMEFSNLSINNLKDTRRLLTDYSFVKSEFFSDENTSPFNNLYFDILYTNW